MKGFRDVFKPGARYIPFFLSILAIALAGGLYKGVLDNYLAEVVKMTEFDRGVMEFFREIPGLLLVFILAVIYTFSAERIYRLGALISLIGMGMQAIVSPTKVLVTLAICIYSLGEHIQMGMKSTIILGLSREDRSGQALGIQNSVGQIGQLVGYIAIIIAFLKPTGPSAYRTVFIAAAVITAIGFLFSMKVAGKSETDSSARRFYFRKKYTKYYMLEVFYGARKQVFMTFGPYVLILFYGAETSVISLLFAISAIACFFLSPVVGKIIDKLGYKIVMVSDTLILVIVCFFYGFAHHIFPKDVAFIVCCVNYVLDAIISLASMASSVYVKDISDSPEEVRATLSTGISVNHAITILIALFGGWIWRSLGMEVLFICSAVLGLANSAYAASIKGKKKIA